jgi:hypothetical protein
VTRVPATDIEDVIVKSVNEHLRSERGTEDSGIRNHSAIAEVIDRIDVYRDRLALRLRSRESPGTIKLPDDIETSGDRLLSIPWQKPPSKRFRCPTAHRETKSGRNDASDWSARLHEAGAGSTRLSQAPSLTPSKLLCANDVASVMST